MYIKWIVVGGALLVTTLTGCSVLSDDAGSGTGSSAGSVSVPAGSAAAVDVTKPIVTATVDSAMGKVDLAILSLAARGRLMHLSFAVTPHVTSADPPTLYRLNGGQVPDVSLLDPVNLKRYIAVKDTAGNTLAPDFHATLNNNQPNTIGRYTYAAPPDNVRALDVQIAQFPTFRNVPVSR